MNDSLFQKAKKKIGPPPIWIMRQAGRYLDEYKEIRKTEKKFLNLCYNTEKAAEITLLPIKKFKLDAAIIFSDILVLPDVLGIEVNFIEGTGPILKQFKTYNDLTSLRNQEIDTSKLDRIYEAISLVKHQISKDTSLIGFVGSPWTVISYMLEGRGKQKNFEVSKSFVFNNYKLTLELIEFITQKTIMHLKSQIKAGATIVKLFDSWSGVLSEDEYQDLVIKPTKFIVQEIKKTYPLVPVIGFPKGSGYLYENYINETNIDIIAVDQHVPLSQIRKWQDKIIVQGNLDPIILLSNRDVIKNKLAKLFSTLKRENYIFNLGHGILPNTPVDNVEFLLDCLNDR